MTTATKRSKPAWQARVTRKVIESDQQFVELSHPDETEFRFKANRRKGRLLSFTYERDTGTERTLPEREGWARCLTLNAFGVKLAGLARTDRANEIIRSLGRQSSFGRPPVIVLPMEEQRSGGSNVTTATTSSRPAWRVEVVEESRPILQDFVDVTRPNSNRLAIRFRVNRRDGRIVSFTDYREYNTGTAGTTGIWGTRPPQPPGKRRSLTPTGFRYELIELVGEEQTARVIESLGERKFFSGHLRQL
jgi:hypothetical protein